MISLTYFVVLVLCCFSTDCESYGKPKQYLNLKKQNQASARALHFGNDLEALPKGSVILIDGDNVRGKTSFSVTKEKLLNDLDLLQERFQLTNKLQLYFDHGTTHEAYRQPNGVSLVFSGDQTADDIICRDVGWYHKRFNNHVVVITSDSGLKARCHRAARFESKIKVVDSYLFNDLMDSLSINNDIEEDVKLEKSSPNIVESRDVDLARLELRLRDQIRSMQRLSKLRSGGRKKRTDFRRRLSELEARLLACLEKRGQTQEESSACDGANQNDLESKQSVMNVADEKTVVKLLRLGSGLGREETWERCLHAERLRIKQLFSHLERLDKIKSIGSLLPEGSTQTCALDIYAAEVNKNFSSTRFPVLEAASVAERQLLLGIANPTTTMLNNGSIDITQPHISRSLRLPNAQTMRLRKKMNVLSSCAENPIDQTTVPYSIISGCRLFNISLSADKPIYKPKSDLRQVDGTELEEKALLRIVCVSDTHAMERVLDPFVLHGDVLIHAGDYVGGKGASRNKNSRSKYKGLDEWLSTFKHTVKVVVRGNHDPINAIFKKSGAFTSTAASILTLKVHDGGAVSVISTNDDAHYDQEGMCGKNAKESESESGIDIVFGLQPFGSMTLPRSCDILVSHEPPRGVLDETLKKGKRGGSENLLSSFNKLQHELNEIGLKKEEPHSSVRLPRLWLCGHIHEGFGAEMLGDNKYNTSTTSGSGTLVVNAANANPGPAHSLLNLPTVIDVYR